MYTEPGQSPRTRSGTARGKGWTELKESNPLSLSRGLWPQGTGYTETNHKYHLERKERRRIQHVETQHLWCLAGVGHADDLSAGPMT